MTAATTPKPCVLIVEDDESIGSALEYVVRHAGYDCILAAQGRDAQRLLAELHPALILLDIMLPDISGYEILDGLRQNAGLAATKVLMMTARGSASEQRRALEHGADGFVSKPFDLAVLRREIARLIGAAA